MSVTEAEIELNLLPWRAQVRRMRRIQLLIIVVASMAVVGAVVAWAGTELWRQWARQSALVEQLQEREQAMRSYLHEQTQFAAAADESLSRAAQRLRSRRRSAQVSQLFALLAPFDNTAVFQTIDWQDFELTITAYIEKPEDLPGLRKVLETWASDAGWLSQTEPPVYQQGTGVHLDIRVWKT